MLKIQSFHGQPNLGLCEHFVLFIWFIPFFSPSQKDSCFSSQKHLAIIASLHSIV